MKAREIQRERFKTDLTFNSNMSQKDIQNYCALSSSDEVFFENAIKKLNLTARSFFKILKVGRTIADLEGSKNIEKKHILEAISYKNLYRNYRV